MRYTSGWSSGGSQAAAAPLVGASCSRKRWTPCGPGCAGSSSRGGSNVKRVSERSSPGAEPVVVAEPGECGVRRVAQLVFDGVLRDPHVHERQPVLGAGQPSRELARLGQDEVGPPFADRVEHAGQRRGGVEPGEDLQGTRVGLGGRQPAAGREHRRALRVGCLRQRPRVVARGPDTAQRRASRRDEHRAARGADGVQEREQRGEVTGRAGRRHEDAHIRKTCRTPPVFLPRRLRAG